MAADLPTLVIVITSDKVGATVIALIKNLTGRSLGEIKADIKKGQPVVVSEMFSDEYYDGGAEDLVSLMDALEENGVSFDVYEIEEGKTYESADLEISRISAEIFRNIVESSKESRDRFDE